MLLVIGWCWVLYSSGFLCVSSHYLIPLKAMAPHSNTLVLKVPWMEEPGRLRSMGSLRVRHDWATLLSLFTFTNWRRKWQPHSSVLAWRIPGTGESSGLLSMGSHRVGHDWSYLGAAGLVLWQSRVLESVLLLQTFRAWSRLLHGSVYYFPLVRYSWPFSAGVLHALLGMKVHSCCICGKRCAPCSPTPPSSCFEKWILSLSLKCAVLL